jgi:hypothetical protein
VSGAALVGCVIWILGLVGLANRAESICFADVDNQLGYGAYEISRELWLPSFECRLLGDSVEPIVVEHPLEAIVTIGWVVGVPVLFAAATLAVSVCWARRAR